MGGFGFVLATLVQRDQAPDYYYDCAGGAVDAVRMILLSTETTPSDNNTV